MEYRSGETQNWLAETKFSPPLPRDDIIPRPRLLHDLRSKLDSHPLTLLSAPAGYGKTTLLAALPLAYPELSIAWLSLDDQDNDPVLFLTAVIAALQRLHPTCGSTAQSLLASRGHGGTGVRRVVSVLINDLLQDLSEPCALILDDLHRVTEPSIFVALDYLLEHSPPQLHLGLSTRVDPPLALARLRARGELGEMRLAELRFSEEESRTFLNDRLNLGLSAGNLVLLHSRTEGWAAGLRLIAGSLGRAPPGKERRRLIRHLATTDRNIFEFLAEEVFDYQEADIRTFLLETAILPELTPALCHAVTRRPGARTMLDELYRRNLFLVQVSPSEAHAGSELGAARSERPRLDATGPHTEKRYRYHDLFSEFLRHKLWQSWPDRVPDLHVRAARAESEPARAVGHYLSAHRWPDAADLIEDIGAEMFARGYLDTLRRWINALPAVVWEARPRLLHYLSHCAFWKGSFSEVQPLLERALQGFQAAGDGAGQGEVLVDLAICSSAQGALERSGALYGQALAYPVPPHARIEALLGRALTRGALGDWPPFTC